MQRKPTSNTRGPNAEEKRYHNWIKTEKSCCDACGQPRPLILHHCEGATFKHRKTLIGHWFCIGLCGECDQVVTLGSRREFREKFGPQCELWAKSFAKYKSEDISRCVDFDVTMAIMDWGK